MFSPRPISAFHHVCRQGKHAAVPITPCPLPPMGSFILAPLPREIASSTRTSIDSRCSKQGLIGLWSQLHQMSKCENELANNVLERKLPLLALTRAAFRDYKSLTLYLRCVSRAPQCVSSNPAKLQGGRIFFDPIAMRALSRSHHQTSTLVPTWT